MHIRVHILAFLTAIIMLANPINGYSQDPVYRQFTMEEGLPSNEVYHVFQDSKGYIWFATNNGVSRFNGVEFSNFGFEDGLLDLTVFEIYEDFKGRIWFVPMSGQLTYFENGKIYPYKYNHIIEDFNKGFEGPIKNGFFIDKNDIIYISISRIGLIRIKNENDWDLIKVNNKYSVWQIYYVDNKISIPISNDTLHYSDSLKYWVTFPEFKTKYKYQAKLNYRKALVIRCLSKINNTFEILTVGKNLLLLDNNKKSIDTITLDSDIIYVTFENTNTLLCGTLKNGVTRVEIADNKFVYNEQYFKSESVSSILIDNENGFWLSSLSNGAYFIPNPHAKQYLFNPFIKKYVIGKLTHLDNTMYASPIQSKYLIKINDTVTNITKPNNLIINSIFTFDNKLIIGGNKGLFSLKQNCIYKVNSTYRGAFYSFFSYYDTLLVAGSWKLFQYDNPKTFWSQNEKMSMQLIRTRIDAIQKINNTIYLGTSKGLYKYKNNVITHLANQNSMLESRILTMAKYANSNNLIIGTKGNGLLIMSGDSVVKISKTNGLADDIIYDIFYRNKNLFCGTNNGLSIITFNTNTDYTIKNYYKKHGLTDNVINDIEFKDSVLYLATNNGICFFNPDKLKPNTTHPPIYISQIKVNDQDTLLHNGYELSNDQNDIIITYEGLAYKSANTTTYKYRINENENWRYTTNNFVEFNSLLFGKYKFEILACNEDDTWSDIPANIEFTIKPPYYKTWWFILFEIIFGIAAIGYVFRLRYRILSKRNNCSLT